MLRSASVSEIRAAEEPLLADDVPLMQQAAQAVAAAVTDDGFQPPDHVVLLVGAGNNGGDALWAGSYLASEGFTVTAYLLADSVHAEGLAALQANGGQVLRVIALTGSRQPIAARTGGMPDVAASSATNPLANIPTVPVAVASAQIAHAQVIIDGILGIGANGALRGVASDLVQETDDYWGGKPLTPYQRGRRPWVIAVDCPSGILLDGENAGQVPGPVLAADHTVTFGAPKPGLELPPASHYVGKLNVVDMGFDLQNSTSAPQVETRGEVSTPSAAGPHIQRLTADDVAYLLRVPGPADQKYSRGVVGVVAGSSRYPGAAMLTTAAASNSGAGMVRYLGPASVSQMVVAAHPEVTLGGGQVQSWVLGPGIPTELSGDPDDGQLEKVRASLSQATGALPGAGGAVPAVVDAGALQAISKPLPPWVVLTPHAGELAALMSAHGVPTKRSDVEANPLAAAQQAQKVLGGTIVLKGSTTLIVGPGGTVYSQADAPHWLATAGAGDVLAGLLGTMLAARAPEVIADPNLAAEIAAAAVYLHGKAADQANPGGPVTASAVANRLPTTIAHVLNNA